MQNDALMHREGLKGCTLKKCVSSYRDPQLQVGENYSYL